MRKKTKAYFSFFVTLLVCSILIAIIIWNKQKMENLFMERLIMEKSMKMHDVISKLLYKTEALSALVIQSNGEVKDFERIAATIIDDPAILNILVAPSGVVSKVYPLEGNEAVIGFDFFGEGAGNKEAVMAKETGELVFGGPFTLVQGGQALVGRLPVFLDAGDGNKTFWGLVSVTLKYPEALKDADLDEIERDGLSYVIWRNNPDDGKKQVIASSGRYDPKHIRYTEKHVQILNANWYFQIVPNQTWYEYPETWILFFLTLCISILVAFLVQKNMDLKLAKEQAEQASNAKSVFLANMNHEIRTPMSGIIGFADLAAKRDMEPSKMKDYLNKIKDSADGLMGIIEDILDVEKIETGEMSIERIPFDLHESVSICESICQLKAMEKGINLSVDVPPTLTNKLMGDPKKLRRILLCLLSNAVKFTKEGFVTLTVTQDSNALTKVSQMHLRFEIKDSGIGIPAEQLESIFHSFTQVDDSIRREYGGSGLGLSIAYRLVKLMGGELLVDSAPDQGSLFYFSLSFPISEESIEVNSINMQKTEEEPVIFRGDVLVCEDNETNQMVIQGHLSKLGLCTDIASNGRIGLEMVKERMKTGNPYDLILMDIHMPEMDGLQTARALMDIGNPTPIVALTANALKEDVENYKSHGMPTCLGKPFRLPELKVCLLKYLTPVNGKVIDMALAIERFEGDKALYGKVINNFYGRNKSFLNQLDEAVDRGDYKLAHRLVHSLRGSAGTIGATRLANAAYPVENALINTMATGTYAESYEECLSVLKSEFLMLLSEMEPHVVKKNIRENPLEMDKIKTFEAIHTIAPLLKMGNSKSLEYLEDMEEALIPIMEKCRLAIEQVKDYEFDLAYETIMCIREFLE